MERKKKPLKFVANNVLAKKIMARLTITVSINGVMLYNVNNV